MKALVFGQVVELLEAIPALLSRAGFSVDVISTDAVLARCKLAKSFTLVGSSNELVETALQRSKETYDLIVASDDATLRAVKQSRISTREKLSLLPILCADNLDHISSKIGLSRLLARHKIKTPEFSVAQNFDELQRAVRHLRVPLLIKIDFSFGGNGIFPIRAESDIARYEDKITYPVLLQKEVKGDLLDLSGFFQDGQLVHFAYSEVLSTPHNEYGPSAVRRYRSLASLDPAIFARMSELGAALGANGFANIGCIRATGDQGIYFFEADMRPNVWVEHSRYFNDDPAIKMHNYFHHRVALKPEDYRDNYRSDMILTRLPRIGLFDILRNRYNCTSHYENYLGRNIYGDICKGKLIAGLRLFGLKHIKPRCRTGGWALITRVAHFLMRAASGVVKFPPRDFVASRNGKMTR